MSKDWLLRHSNPWCHGQQEHHLVEVVTWGRGHDIGVRGQQIQNLLERPKVSGGLRKRTFKERSRSRDWQCRVMSNPKKRGLTNTTPRQAYVDCTVLRLWKSDDRHENTGCYITVACSIHVRTSWKHLWGAAVMQGDTGKSHAYSRKDLPKWLRPVTLWLKTDEGWTVLFIYSALHFSIISSWW